MTRLHTLIRHCKKQSFSKTFALFLFTLILAGCAGLENQLPGTAIPAAPTLEIGTATAALVIENSETSTEDNAGFPPPEDTTEPPTAIPDPTATITEAVERPTPTVQAISVPPNQPLDPNNLPPTNHDLAYISAGTLWLWTHHNRQIIPLFAPEIDSERFPAGTFAEVALVDFSADGNRAVVAVRYDLPPEEGAGGDGSGDSEAAVEEETGVTEFDILYVDTVSKESWGMISGVKNTINELSISPDQAYIAFSTVIDDGRNDNAAMGELKEFDGKLFRFNTPSAISPSDLTQVAECFGNCRQIKWRGDSDLYFFSDQQGVYIANARSTNAELLIENELRDQYYPLQWSPNARAVLMLDRPKEGGATYAVFDIPTQKLIPIPSKLQADTVQLPNTIWLADSRVIHSFVVWESGSIFLVTYRVNFDDGTIGLDEEVEMAEMGMLGSLKQLNDGRFVYVRPNLTDPNAAGLYRLTSFTEQPERINGIPLTGDTPDGIWSLDGSTAVIQTRMSYLAAADGNLFQFEQRIAQPTWLPPSNAQR